MELSMNIGYLRKKRGTTEKRDIAECAKICKDAGFRYLDFDVLNCVDIDNWENFFLEANEKLKEADLVVDQTHAPFVYSRYEPEHYKTLMQRSFEASNILGAKNIVIHADKYIPDENGFDFDKALNEIYDFYAPYVEYAKKVGLGVAIENLFESDRNGPRKRFTSYIEEQKAIIEKFNDPLVTACWDFGHGNVSYGEDMLDAMKEMGSLITCTHVHDNIFRRDLHQNLFLGSTDWEGVIKYMKEMDYKGKFTFEMVYGCIPDELLPRYMKLFYDTGMYLLNL